jgi:PKD domain-containing protein
MGRSARCTGCVAGATAAAVVALVAPTAFAGPTWLPAQTIRGTLGGSPAIAVDARGDTVAGWYEFPYHDTEQWGAYRPAGGPWLEAQDVGHAAGGGSIGTTPRVALDDAGNATFLYGSRSTGAELWASLRLASSGAVLQPPADLVIPNEEGFSDPAPSLAIDAQGDAAVAASDGRSRIDVRTRSTSEGAWSAPKTFTQPGRTISNPQAALDAAGNVVVAWVSTAGDGSAVFTAVRTIAGTWSGPTQIRPPAGPTIRSLELAVSPAGTAVLAFHEGDPGGTTIRALARDASGAWREDDPTLPVIPGGAYPSAFPDVALDASGAGYLVFSLTDDAGDQTEIRAERMTPGGAWGAIENLGAGSDPRIATDAAGNAAAVWRGADGRAQSAQQPAGAVFQPARPISDVAVEAPQLAIAGTGDGAAVWTSAAGVQVAGLDGTGPALPAPSIPPQVSRGQVATFSVGAAVDAWSGPAGPPVWDLGDGTRLTGSSVTHAYAAAGDYAVSVSQGDAVGNQTVRRGSVHVVDGVPLGASGAGAPIPTRGRAKPPSPIAIGTVALRGHYRRSRLVGGVLAVRGVSTDAVSARLSLRRLGSLPAGAAAAAFSARLTVRKGPFALRLPVKANLLPGRYTLRVRTPGTADARRAVALAAPPEGVVVRAYASAVLGGPPVVRLQGSPTAAFARFVFAARPRRGRITLVWYPPHGGRPTVVQKPRLTTVDALIKSGAPLPKGVWRCVLRAGPVVVKEIRVPVG